MWHQPVRRQNLLPSPSYRALKRASSSTPGAPASQLGLTGAGCCSRASASCSEVGSSTLYVFWQAALSKARPPISAYLPSPPYESVAQRPHPLPELTVTRDMEGLAEKDRAWQTPSLQDLLTPSTEGTGAQAGGAACLQILFAFVFCFSFFFSCFLQKGPDAFSLAGLPWPGARGGTRNAVCECVSVCVQYAHTEMEGDQHINILYCLGHSPGSCKSFCAEF